MHKAYILVSLHCFFFTLFVIFTGATFYEEEDIEISKESIVKRWTGISKSTCILRCRRYNDCLSPAIYRSECILLQNYAKIVASDENRILKVTILKELAQKKPKKSPGKIF